MRLWYSPSSRGMQPPATTSAASIPQMTPGTRYGSTTWRTTRSTSMTSVDDLIEAVIKRGGWVAFVEDGELVEHGRVALVTTG